MTTVDPVDRLLALLTNVKPLSTGGHTARCPAHDDQHNSLKVDRGDDGQALIHCHAGCPPNVILERLQLSLADLFPPSNPATVHRNGHSKHLVATKRYEVIDRDSGEMLAVHVRRDFSDGSKMIHWEQPDGAKGLAGRNLADFPLWGLESLQDANSVIVAEGEKAADALRSIGIPAVGTYGAGVAPGDASLRPLLGKLICLWPDNDEPGRAHMDRIGRALLAIGQAPELIRLLAWKSAPPKGDAYDWVITHGDPERLRGRMASAPQWTPADVTEEPAAAPEGGGEEPRSLSHAELLALELPPARPLVEGLIEEQSGCILAGPGGTGKTWISLDLARSIASGIPWLGHFPVNQAPVLVIDEEGNERGIQSRLRLLNAAQPLDDPPLWFSIARGLRIDQDATQAIIAAEIERYSPGVVIFDSLTRMHGANENDASEMSRVFARFSTLRRLYGCTIVLIDHVRKKGLINEEIEMLRGTTDKRNWPDTILFLSPAERGTMTLSHVKSRYGEAKPDFTIALEIDNDAGSGRVRYQGQAQAKHVGKGNEIIAAIHALKTQLGEDGADVTTIAAWLDASDDTVRRHVKRLVQNHILRVRQVRTDGRPKDVYDVAGGYA